MIEGPGFVSGFLLSIPASAKVALLLSALLEPNCGFAPGCLANQHKITGRSFGAAFCYGAHIDGLGSEKP